LKLNKTFLLHHARLEEALKKFKILIKRTKKIVLFLDVVLLAPTFAPTVLYTSIHPKLTSSFEIASV